MWISHGDIQTVEFGRAMCSSRTFDFQLNLVDGRSIEFGSIAREELDPLSGYVEQSKLKLSREHERNDSGAEGSMGKTDDDSEEEVRRLPPCLAY